MSLEQTLSGWTGPSSDTEQEKQDRTERMIREAVRDHPGFRDCNLSVFAKGSYANNTNVRADSDVDIAVQCHDVIYYKVAKPGPQPPLSPYKGIWTPGKLRSELSTALTAKFPAQVDETGKIAFTIRSSSARIDADVVPCFDYRYYFSAANYREGNKVWPKSGPDFENYPGQQLANGNAKNKRTNNAYKRAVRVIKRIENAMVTAKYHREVPSFFMECLVYNCPDDVILRPTWTDKVKGILYHVWNELQGDEPDDEPKRWREVNECKYLFFPAQKWTRADGREFAYAAWNHLGFK